MILVKITIVMIPENIEKKHIFKTLPRKITLLWYPKNRDNIWFFVLKSHNYDASNYWKKNVFKKSSRQNHNTMMSKNYRSLMMFCQHHNSMMSEKSDKIKYLRRHQGKITLLDTQKIQLIYKFLLKSHYYDARK